MGEAIGQLLPFAVGIAISPMPIVAVVLMLVTPRARVNGPAFVAGWVLGLAVVGGIALAVAGPANASESGGPARWVSWLELVLGLLLMAVAARQWRTRPRADQPPAAPAWMDAIDGFTAPKAAGTAALLGGINPKNFLLVVGGCAAIAQTGISTSQQVVALFVMIVIGTIGVLTPVVIYFVMGSRATAILQNLKAWMVANNAVIMAVLCVIIGVKLIGDGVSGLSS